LSLAGSLAGGNGGGSATQASTEEHVRRNRSGTGFMGSSLQRVTDTFQRARRGQRTHARHRAAGHALCFVGSRSRFEDARVGRAVGSAGPACTPVDAHSQSGRRGGSTPAQPRVWPWPNRSMRAARLAGVSHPSPRRRSCSKERARARYPYRRRFSRSRHPHAQRRTRAQPEPEGPWSPPGR